MLRVSYSHFSNRTVRVSILFFLYIAFNNRDVFNILKSLTTLMHAPAIVNVLSKAVENTREGITITDATKPGHPLIYINAGFTRITGYNIAESLGRNCRFLQGPGTDPMAVQQLRDALQSGTAVQVELLNYTKEGKPFWNKLTLTPVMENSRITHFIGIQEDITAAKERQALLQQIARHQLIADTTIEVQEQERNALANELHDNINQLLATVKLYLDIARTEETMRTEMIQRSQALTNNVIEEIRTLSHTLASPDLKNTTLKDAMEELIQNLDKAVPLRTAFHYDAGIERLLSHNQKLGIYRIVQEAFNNILKHAQATEVTLNFRKKGSGLHLTLHDNGKGFDVNARAAGIGLKSMRNRVQLIGGEWHLYSAPGQGCTVTITFPGADKTKNAAG
jgi:PAS domain S-box-containing protein